MEHCDWFPALLTGMTDPLTITAEQVRGRPQGDVARVVLRPPLRGIPDEAGSTAFGTAARLFRHTATSDRAAGTISAAWAAKLGLPPDVQVGVGAFDAHMGAVGGEIDPYVMTKIMGTSTCDMIVVPAGDMEGKLVTRHLRAG